MKGIIIIGYPGIGKSSCGGKDNCIDLRSEDFYIHGKRNDNWYTAYCQTAISLAEQGYTVFVSSHEGVQDFLCYSEQPRLRKIKVFVLCPRRIMKDEWIERLRERYFRTKLDKDYRALKHVEENYEEDIAMLCGYLRLPVYQPEAMDYDLMDYVKRMRNIVSKAKKVEEKYGED